MRAATATVLWDLPTHQRNRYACAIGKPPTTYRLRESAVSHRLVLASTSQWRLGLLREAGVDCVAEDPGVDESTVQRDDPVELALARAVAKARAVQAAWPHDLVCGADQVLHMDAADGVAVFGKPADEQAWARRLKGLRGRTHQLTTGVALLCGEPGHEVDDRFSVTTDVRFRADVSDAEIAAYIRLGEARGCAGGYMVERRGAWLVEAIDGDWLNVVGLPVLHLIGRLRALGWRLEA